MMNNEDRADIGAIAVAAGARETRVDQAEDASTAICDVLAYIAHFCDRLGLAPQSVFDDALTSYEGDWEDGPRACKCEDPDLSLAELGYAVGRADG